MIVLHAKTFKATYESNFERPFVGFLNNFICPLHYLIFSPSTYDEFEETHVLMFFIMKHS